MKIGYVIAAYFGPRHTPNEYLINDPLFYIKQQIEGLSRQQTVISKIYIICTFDDNVESDSIISYLKQLKESDNRIHLFFKDNLGGSYCSWQYALWQDNGDVDYMFLVEDDYILDDPNGISFVIKHYFNSIPDLFYLCQYWSTQQYVNDFGDDIPEHAAMSCGIINNKLYFDYKNNENLDFLVIDEHGYDTMWRNQVRFLENYRKLGLKILDWTDTCSSYFPQSNLEYGNPEGIRVLKALGSIIYQYE